MPRRPLPRRPSRSLIVAACACLCACGSSVEPQQPPRPDDLAQFDSSLVEALEESLAAIDAQPTDSAAWWQLAQLYEAHVLLEYAAECYEFLTRATPNDPKAWYRLAIVLEREGRVDEALAAFERVHALAPDYGPAFRRRARCLLGAGRVEPARTAFENALRCDPDDVSARLGLVELSLESGAPEAVLAELEALEPLQGQDKVLGHRLRGLALARLGREAEAESELFHGQGARPGGPDPWSRGLQEFKVGESALLLRSARLLDKGQIGAALELLEPASRRACDDGRIWRRLASAYTRAARHAEAADALGYAALLEPGEPDLWLGVAVARRSAGDLAAAREALEFVLALAPSRAQAHWLRADLLLTVGEFEAVLRAAAEAPVPGRARAPLEASAGKALLELARPQEAREHFVIATQLDPELPDGWAGRALSGLALSAADETRAALDRLLLLDPEHALLPALRAGLARLEGEQ